MDRCGEVMKKRKMAVTGIDKPIAELASRTAHRSLAIWAADCAERALLYFEDRRPGDDRPRKAIEAARAWARTGVFRMADVRKASLDAHAAAREIAEGTAARSAARAAGQAIATAHVPSHAIATAIYAATAVCEATEPSDADTAMQKERVWQYQRLLELNKSARLRDESSIMPPHVLESRLIAPCGMNCALCMAYQRPKNKCHGCRDDDPNKSKSCRSCIIRNCSIIQGSSSHFCYECDKMPCKRLRQLDARYRSKYGMSMIVNLNGIKEQGMDVFLNHQAEKYTCPTCYGPLCVHRPHCLSCGSLKTD
jgi:hypothetical protein